MFTHSQPSVFLTCTAPAWLSGSAIADMVVLPVVEDGMAAFCNMHFPQMFMLV